MELLMLPKDQRMKFAQKMMEQRRIRDGKLREIGAGEAERNKADKEKKEELERGKEYEKKESEERKEKIRQKLEKNKRHWYTLLRRS